MSGEVTATPSDSRTNVEHTKRWLVEGAPPIKQYESDRSQSFFPRTMVASWDDGVLNGIRISGPLMLKNGDPAPLSTRERTYWRAADLPAWALALIVQAETMGIPSIGDVPA